MAEKSGYGMDAVGARKPSSMPPSKSEPDSGKPDGQYRQGSSAANVNQNSIKSSDSGSPASNH